MFHEVFLSFVDEHKAELEAETGLTFENSGIGREVRLKRWICYHSNSVVCCGMTCDVCMLHLGGQLL